MSKNERTKVLQRRNVVWEAYMKPEIYVDICEIEETIEKEKG